MTGASEVFVSGVRGGSQKGEAEAVNPGEAGAMGKGNERASGLGGIVVAEWLYRCELAYQSYACNITHSMVGSLREGNETS